MVVIWYDSPVMTLKLDGGAGVDDWVAVTDPPLVTLLKESVTPVDGVEVTLVPLETVTELDGDTTIVNAGSEEVPPLPSLTDIWILL